MERESRTTPIGLASAPGARAAQISASQVGQGPHTPRQMEVPCYDSAKLPLPTGEVEVVEGRWQDDAGDPERRRPG